MKITAIRTIRTDARPSVIWVEIDTENGLTGLGETWFGAGAVEADIHERIAPLILGGNASEIDALNKKMRPYVGFAGTGAEMRALSAVDVALWDIAGKAAGKPLHALLGGACREKIKVYNTCAGPDYVSKTSEVKPGNFGLPGEGGKARTYEDLDAFLNRADELASDLLSTGISSMKIWPFDFAAGAADGMDISAADLKMALAPFEKVRKAHGNTMRLKAELHGLWSLPAAQKICSALEPLEIDWVEDPVWMDRFTDLSALGASTSAPLAGGETLGGLGQIRSALEAEALSTLIVDVTWGGGITFGREAAALAGKYSKPIAFHDCSGPVTLVGSTHLALSCQNVNEQEIARAFYYGWYHEYVDALPQIEKGFITVPNGAGLGLTLAPDLVNRKCVSVRTSSFG
ncbi:MAG: mandelate racemase/muconate lactonizing enzyme family protein [Hyphomicrobiales bacterium]